MAVLTLFVSTNEPAYSLFNCFWLRFFSRKFLPFNLHSALEIGVGNLYSFLGFVINLIGLNNL